MKMIFESIQITIFSEKQRMLAVVVGASGDKTRQDVEQGSILPTKANKLLVGVE